MPIYKNISSIRKLTNSSLTSIIDVTNLNFNSLSSGVFEFLNKISYDESANSMTLTSLNSDQVSITDLLSLKLDGVTTFSIDSLGRAEGQELLVKVAETKRLRLTDFNDWPEIGVPGEIIYTGVQNQRPEFGEDFIGYLQNKGWVSLTDKGNSSFITLIELSESPPLPGCPAPNTGRVWVGPPGYATQTVPSTQTLYYTDENCQIFDLTTGGSGGGGNAGACSFVTTQNFIAGVPRQINHNLDSTNVHVQLIKTLTNEQITGFISSYQANSLVITLSETLSQVKVIILSADCGDTASPSDIPSFFYRDTCPPIEPGEVRPGSLWYHQESGKLFVYIYDPESDQYVWATPATECCPNNLEVNISLNSATCVGSPAVLQFEVEASALGGAAPYIYTWSFASSSADQYTILSPTLNGQTLQVQRNLAATDSGIVMLKVKVTDSKGNIAKDTYLFESFSCA